jgi:hypothetical protein
MTYREFRRLPARRGHKPLQRLLRARQPPILCQATQALRRETHRETVEVRVRAGRQRVHGVAPRRVVGVARAGCGGGGAYHGESVACHFPRCGARHHPIDREAQELRRHGGAATKQDSKKATRINSDGNQATKQNSAINEASVM